MAKHFRVNIPNIPAVFNDELGPEHRAWLKEQHPADYAYFVKQEKEFEAENAPASDAEGEKEATKPAPATTKTEAAKPATSAPAKPESKPAGDNGGAK